MSRISAPASAPRAAGGELAQDRRAAHGHGASALLRRPTTRTRVITAKRTDERRRHAVSTRFGGVVESRRALDAPPRVTPTETASAHGRYQKRPLGPADPSARARAAAAAKHAAWPSPERNADASARKVSRFSAKGASVAGDEPSQAPRRAPKRDGAGFRRRDGIAKDGHAELGGVRLGDRGGALGSAREAEPRGGGVSSALGQDARLSPPSRRSTEAPTSPTPPPACRKAFAETRNERRVATRGAAFELSPERGIGARERTRSHPRPAGAWHAASPAARRPAADSAATRAGSIVATTTPEVSSGAVAHFTRSSRTRARACPDADRV